MRVLKFGGTSVADAQRVVNVSEIAINTAIQVQTALVLSAPAGVTNILVSMVKSALAGSDCKSEFGALDGIVRPLINTLDSQYQNFDGNKVPAEVLERTRREVIDLMKQQLKPEFLNRIDEIVMFEPLTREDIERIVDLQLNSVRKLLAENNIRLEYTAKAREWIAKAGYDPLYGARPVKRTIQRYVVNDLSKRILAGEVDRSKPISIDADANGLTFAN